jgi:hypothetical protein
MRIVFPRVVPGALAALAAAGMACAQAQVTAQSPAPVPATAPASAPAPMTAASRQVPDRNPTLTAAENTREPGDRRPEERVVPQISIPLKSRSAALAPVAAASTPVAAVPGGVDDAAARCLATRNPVEKAACERALPASAPAGTAR